MSLEPTARILEIRDELQAEKELAKTGCDPVGIRLMKAKAVFCVVKISRVRSKAANLIKQTFLSKGGDAAVSRNAADLSEEYTDVLIFATRKQYRQSLSQLKLQPWGLKALALQIERLLDARENGPQKRAYYWKDRSLTLDGGHSLVMGILNLTPDSFSDGGRYDAVDAAVRRALQLAQDGADIIDVGAESTRPYEGAEKISAEMELERLMPALEKILANCGAPVSVDTYKASVAKEAINCGAHMINDIWGLQYDADMADVAAKADVPVIVMHNRETAAYSVPIMQDILQYLQKSIDIGIESGIRSENIIIDPGIGFAKTMRHNLEIMAHLDELHVLGCPVLLGTSRKRFIGRALDLPVDERVEGTIATAALGKLKGVQIHRVHDVKEVKRALKMMDVMMGSVDDDEIFD